MTRRLQILFVLALTGVVIALGIGVTTLLGWIGLTAYAVVLVALAAFGAVRGQGAHDDAGGHSCDCCAAADAAPVPAGSVKLS